MSYTTKTADPRRATPRVRFFAGLDVAQQRDYSALAILERVTRYENDLVRDTEVEDRLVHLERWKTTYPDLLEKIRHVFEQRLPGDLYPFARYASLAVDATGPGLPFYEDLKRAGIPLRTIRPITITAGQGGPNGGHVPKPYLITRLQLALQNQHFKIPRGLAYLDAFTKELEGYEMKVTASHNITYSNNPREGGPEHDDLILAAALAYFGLTYRRPPRVVRGLK